MYWRCRAPRLGQQATPACRTVLYRPLVRCETAMKRGDLLQLAQNGRRANNTITVRCVPGWHSPESARARALLTSAVGRCPACKAMLAILRYPNLNRTQSPQSHTYQLRERQACRACGTLICPRTAAHPHPMVKFSISEICVRPWGNRRSS